MAPFARTTLPAHLDPIKGRGRGQPTLYDPVYCDAVIEAMAEGLSLTAFAGTIRVAIDTVYEWIKVHREFSDAVSRAKPARTLWLERKLLKSRKGAETTAAIFALRNASPDEWRDIKHTSSTTTHRIETLTDQQLYAIASGNQPGDGRTIEGEATRVATR